MRLSLILGCLAATLVYAQSPTDVFEMAPPEVEKALRDRVAVFFQAHVDGKYRRAEQVIHEDSLDDFYNSEKTKLINYKISRIKWSDNFTKADVIADVELDWVTSRGIIRVKPPMKSYWKVDKGQWWWYVQHNKGWETPFGTMSAAKPEAGGTAGSQPAPAPVHIPTAQEILSQISVTKTEIALSSTQNSQDEAEIKNSAPGEVNLAVMPYTVPGLTLKIDKPTLKQGETAHLTFTYEPPNNAPKAPVIVYVESSPLKKVFSFTLAFSAPQRQAPVAQPPVVRVR